MNFKQLEAFYWLTRLKSYQRVAEHINLTQSAVSVRVVGLEESLGVKLIESNAPNFKLTEKGMQAAEFAEAFVNLDERMRTGLTDDAAKPRGIGLFITSRISGAPLEEIVKSVLPYFIPLLLATFIIVTVPQLSLWLPNLLLGAE